MIYTNNINHLIYVIHICIHIYECMYRINTIKDKL